MSLLLLRARFTFKFGNSGFHLVVSQEYLKWHFVDLKNFNYKMYYVKGWTCL